MTTIKGRPRPGPLNRPIWEEPPSKAGQGVKGGVLVAVVLAVLVPLWVVLLTSLSTQRTITEAGGLVVVPGELTLEAYRQILSGGVITRAVMVSVGVTVVGTAISLTLTILAAYGLSRPGSVLHKPLLMVVLLTFLFGPGLIPTYLVVQGLGLVNTYWALILPSAVAGFNLVVLRAFFMNLPSELIDSARIDGAGEFRILFRIVLPLSKAAVAVIALFYAVGYWNGWFNALLYLDDSTMQPLQLALRSYVLQGQAIPGTSGNEASSIGSGPVPTLAIKMAVMAIATIPMVVVYPFVQKHFTKGVIIGAIKG